MIKEIMFAGIVLFCCTGSVYSQKVIDKSDSKRPSWLSNPPKGAYYRYFTGIGESRNSIKDSKSQAFADVVNEIIMENKIVSKSTVNVFLQESNQEFISRVSSEIEQVGSSTTIEGLHKEEEYWEIVSEKSTRLFRYWILMRYPKPGYREFDQLNIRVKQSYGKIPVIKSLFIPGWGQFHKKENSKGLRFLISETVLVTSALVFNYLSADYHDRALSEEGVKRRKYFNDWSNNFYTFAIIGGITAGALHIYNIFDATTAKGAKIYAYNYNSDKTLNYGIGQDILTVSLSIRF